MSNYRKYKETYKLQIHFTPEQYKHIEKRAEQKQVSKSEIVRQIVEKDRGQSTELINARARWRKEIYD